MTSHVVVFNASLKTVKIPTTPVTYLTEVRDEACKKFNMRADQFTLKYNNKPVALSQQIRLANLAQGARLELVQASRSPTVISVALQLPVKDKNVRLTEKFASNTSLWEIIRHFESGNRNNYNFTQRGVPDLNGTSGAGRLNYEMPVITVMPGHREQSSFIGLQQTLSQLGFDSGSALLRLSFNNSGIPLEEAMAQITQYFKPEGIPASGTPAESSAQPSSTPELDKPATEALESVAAETTRPDEPNPEPMDVNSKAAVQSNPETTSEPAPPLLGEDSIAQPDKDVVETPTKQASPNPEPSSQTPVSPPPRNIQIYAPPASSTPQAARRGFNDADYEPTIEHAKSHQASLVALTRNQRLPSDKEIAEQEAARLERIAAAAEKGGSLRVRMPDQTILQVDITKSDTADFLYTFVRSFLEYADQPFQLKYLGPKGGQVTLAPSSKSLMQDLRFSGREIVTFVWDENASNEARVARKALAKEWLDKAQALKVEEPVVQEKETSKMGQLLGLGKAEGKRKAGMSAGDKESKLKSILGKGLFKK
ncbi:hypothetical protein P154DRAFT_428683 [Amniculicola lignicola CBS 123094]|uniref:UBX domain-containing protein n=1 Tax=Amniculicola lignicola CBS 123094 TaxID=1392246 RepID=A0A6A5WWC0_9PLEO|nr:hypothetical protein P154DRAFT_428683 [Amniculicola lignicola CBS 123094]